MLQTAGSAQRIVSCASVVHAVSGSQWRLICLFPITAKAVIRELETEYGEYFNPSPYGLPDVLEQIYSNTGKGFIFIIDEWDCVFRLAKNRKEKQEEYLDFLRGLFKGAEYVDLA